jgi:hypothetical protein
MDLTNEQIRAIKEGEPVPVVLPGGEECVVVRKDVFQRITHGAYDDSQPTDEELTRLAWESGTSIGWDTPEMAEYDQYEQKQP